jgi:very-short-patch-repair endonuclease
MPRKSRGHASATIVHAARAQRKAPTPAERKLWEVLRDRRLAGLKFRRQHPFDRFILDNYCVKHQLVVEVDGGIHADPAQAIQDAARTEFLEAHGIRVLRFCNEEIEQNITAVVQRILQATGKLKSE